VAAARLQLVYAVIESPYRQAYGGNVSRPVVIARSNCSRIEIESKSNRTSPNHRINTTVIYNNFVFSTQCKCDKQAD